MQAWAWLLSAAIFAWGVLHFHIGEKKSLISSVLISGFAVVFWIGVTKAASSFLLVSSADAAASEVEKFRQAAVLNGFKVKTLTKYGTWNPWANSEDFATIEARKELQSEPWKLMHVLVYQRAPDDAAATIVLRYDWVDCVSRKLKTVSDYDYQETLSAETTGYDPLGNKLPASMNHALKEDELLQLVLALPTIDLNNRVKTVLGKEKPLDHWVHRAYSERMDRYCND